MLRRLDHRAGHYLLLLGVWAVLCLPNLGGPSLWDIDEGNNAEAGQEMYESGNYVVPTFNYRLREDKPVLLYWLQTAAYQVFGISEFSARLPSALAALVAVLAVYELGRRLYDQATGLLAALMLASALAFCTSAHFANPDALLNAATVLTLLGFWNHYRTGRAGWLAFAGAAAGVGVLAKGPVGLVLPLGVTLLFLLWRRDLRRLADRGLLLWGIAFVAVAVPWYVWVGVETKGQWLIGFWKHHHVERMSSSLEGHGGPVWYYLPALIAGFAPWSIFLGPAGWYALRQLRRPASSLPEQPDERAAAQLLVSWMAVYFLFFSAVRTKLPNYILPAYPAVALLTGRMLAQWRRGVIVLPDWVPRVSLACLALMGGGVVAALLIAGDTLHVSAIRFHRLPGMEAWAGLGTVLLAGSAVAWWCLRRQRRTAVLAVLAVTAVAFHAILAARAIDVVDRYKAPRPLAAALPADQLFRDVRLASYRYFQPSLVFYCRRQVRHFEGVEQAYQFLQGPHPSYLFLPEEEWDRLRPFLAALPPLRLVARHYDLYRDCDIVVVTNE